MPQNKIKILGWGKCKIKIEPIANSGASLVGNAASAFFPTPVENSTSLSTTKGDKKEAKIEGGGNEGIKYGRNSYILEFEVRRVAGREFPVVDLDGVVEGLYKVTVIPENESAPGVMIKEGVVSTEDAFGSENGGVIKFVVDSLIPDDESAQLAWDSYSSANMTTVTFTNKDGFSKSVTGEVGSTLTAPSAATGYHWSPSVPAKFPSSNTAFVEEVDE